MDISKVKDQVLNEAYETGLYFSINDKGEDIDIKVFTKYRFNIITHHKDGDKSIDMYAYNNETKEWNTIV